MEYTVNEVLQFVKENDVKFVRLAFCDIFGTLKNISILSNELPRAFDKGIPFEASAIDAFVNTDETDLLLFPDPSTLNVLPWRPQEGRVARLFCDIKKSDGTHFEGDSRNVLINAVDSLRQLGYSCKLGSECEFYLFEIDENGEPSRNPQDKAGYLDVAPLDKGENVRREICLTLEQMDIYPETSHHEQGPGQNEIDFKYSEALHAADDLISFKSVVKAVSTRNGLYASFMPKPLINFSGSGMHINISLYKNNVNIFKNSENAISVIGANFMAGILNRIKDITLFLNPLANSYKRFGCCEAPKYITWSDKTRTQLVRIPAANGSNARMELRSPDPSCNPYLAFALLIYAGLEGIENKLKLFDSTHIKISDENNAFYNYDTLPTTLKEAINAVKQSDFVNQKLPRFIINRYIEVKSNEWELDNGSSSEQESLDLSYFMNI